MQGNVYGVDKGDGEKLAHIIEHLMIAIAIMRHLGNPPDKPDKSDKPTLSPNDIQITETEDVPAKSPRWLEPGPERPRLGFSSANQFLEGASFIKEEAYLEGVNPNRLNPSADGLGAHSMANLPDGGKSIQIGGDQPNFIIHVTVGDQKVKSNPERLKAKIESTFSPDQINQLMNAFKDKQINQRVSILIQDRNNSKKKILFHRLPEQNMGWVVQNANRYAKASNQEVNTAISQMRSQPISEIFNAFKGVINVQEVKFKGRSYDIFKGKSADGSVDTLVVTNKKRELITDPEILKQLGERASAISSEYLIKTPNDEGITSKSKQRQRQLGPAL